MRPVISTTLVTSLLVLAACADPEVGDPAPRRDGGAPSTIDASAPPLADMSTSGPPPDGGSDSVVPAMPDAVVPTGTPGADEVRFNGTERFQQLDGVGANAYAFPYANDLGWTWSQVSDVYDELDLHYVRLASWFEFWEPEPGVHDPSGLIAAHDVGFASFLDERGIDVELGVWQVADWMAGGSPRQVHRDRYSDLGESIASYLGNLEAHGIEQKIVEVQNEPGIEAAIRYREPEDLRDAALAILDALDAAGLGDVMLHGPNWHAPNADAVRFAEVWLANDRLRERTAAVSFHTWWHDDFESFDAIRQVAERHGKPVWATELGYCALPAGCGNGHFLLPETWETAWDLAESFHRAIAWSRAERLYHWTTTGNDPIVDPATGERTPSFYVLEHFANFIEPGSRYVETASGDEQVSSLGFLSPSGDRILILLNDGAAEKRMQLSDAEDLSIVPTEAITTSRGLDAAPARIDHEGDVTHVVLPAQSITSLRF